MPVKNKNRQSNSGYEGVITGLNDEEKKVLEDAGIGGGTPILDLSPYYNSDTKIISQEGMSLLANKIFNNEIVGISLGVEFSCMLLDGIYGATIDFLSRVIGNYGMRTKVLIAMDGKVSQKNEYASLTLPSTSPSSQVIPSITTSNEQQNLTIGDGLAIENGALKTTGSGGIPTANVNSGTFQLDTSSLTDKDQFVIASMDDGGGNIQYIPLQTYFTSAGYYNKEVKMQNYSRGFSLSLTDISFPSANSYTVNAKNTNVDFTSSLDSSKTWNKKGELKYITIEEQNILTREKTYDYLEISGGDYSTEISTLNSRVDSLANEVSQYSGSISSLESRVSSLETASTSYAQAGDVDMLNSRVSDIEIKLGDINSILDNINGEVI